MNGEYSRNVFINCPFDSDYRKMLRAILFTLVSLGFQPRIASERLDSGEARVSKIKELIAECQYGIHDISRLICKEKGDPFRLNMAFELGLDIGAKYFGSTTYANKSQLILEREPYKFQQALSDVSGSDIFAHKDNPREAIRHIRNWFASISNMEYPSPSEIWWNYSVFLQTFDMERASKGFSRKDIYSIPPTEFMSHIRLWIEKHPELGVPKDINPHNLKSQERS